MRPRIAAISLAFFVLAPACERSARVHTAADGAHASERAPPALHATLAFRMEGQPLRTLTLEELTDHIVPRSIEGFDPYYQRSKRFRALPIEAVLREGFRGESVGVFGSLHFVLRAQDGYTVPIDGSRLLEGGAHLAFEDLEVPGWEPIGPRRSNPGPFYLVWSEATQRDLETHPRPWQLASIEIASFASVFPHTVPGDVAASSPTMNGFHIFARECVRCHAINREGGRIGPELNVPQNITEYRPIAQIRAYIRNPLQFRYGAMPAHPHLSEANLDELIAYFTAMRPLKYDPDASPDAGQPAPRDASAPH
ncbi:MAG: cytochrome c [Deltaproteobacteria bacterium]|nr:cytochrome c [Deltaproteobacteria bacterium]